jgi:hypothetical protein
MGQRCAQGQQGGEQGYQVQARILDIIDCGEEIQNESIQNDATRDEVCEER